ncbi:hypothetical protein [[Eubacterium] cellulosolvens]|jgi:hypothetical protein
MDFQRKIVKDAVEVIFMFPFEYWIVLAILGMAASVGVMFWGFRVHNGSYT